MSTSAPSLELRGVYTAIVTPFTAAGAVDYDALRALVEAQIAGGVAGLVPCGTTGESPTLSDDEKLTVITETIKAAKGRVQIIAGTGSNCTADAVEYTRRAKEAGADACLIVNPYYNKPTQAGLIAHIKAIAEVGLPIVLYNIPGRTGINMTPQTVAKLRAEVPMVIAIKEASGSLDQASDIASTSDITILSGEESLTLPLMAVGAKGVISVLSNLLPAKLVEMVTAANNGDFATARKIHLQLLALGKAMFIEVNPVPVKRAMELAGLLPSSSVRLPLVALTPESDAKLQQILQESGVPIVKK